MTAPLYLLDGAPGGAGPLDGVRPGHTVVLDGAEGRHAGTVRRTRVGDRVDVADGLGAVAGCLVTAVGPDRLELAVQALHVVPAPVPRLVLVQALAKGGRDELAVETATELGVDEIVPWQARRSVVVWSGERGRRAHGKWVSTVRAAAKQSRRARLPGVSETVGSAALARRIGEVTRRGGVVLVLHEDAGTPLVGHHRPEAAEQVLVVVGPEGGIDDAEVAAFTAAGARAVRLGPTVLRSSTAGSAALAVLSVRLDRW